MQIMCNKISLNSVMSSGYNKSGQPYMRSSVYTPRITCCI